MQRKLVASFFPDTVCIIVEALKGFLMTQREMTLKDVCVYIMSENFIGQAFLVVHMISR